MEGCALDADKVDQEGVRHVDGDDAQEALKVGSNIGTRLNGK